MARILEDIFNECYERIRSGESLESCLRSYPQYRTQLEPLLRTTFDIGRRVSYIHPRPEFKHWARVRIESAQHYPKPQARAEAPAASTWWRPAWAVAVTVVLVLVLTTGSAMAASLQALPDQPLYPVKLATEQVRAAFAVSDANKAQVETELAKIRAFELEAMAAAGNTAEAAKAAERYDDQFEKALIAIYKAEGTEIQPPIYVPSAVSAPPTTTTPAVSTPPTSTTPPAVSAPPTTTTPAVSTPPTSTTPPIATPTTPPVTTPPPAPITPSENVTPPAPVIPPAPVPPPAPATPSENVTPPAPTTPPTSTATDTSKSAKAEQLRKSLHNSRSKSITALQDAKDKASQEDKNGWQKAIDNMKKSQTSTTGKDATSQSDNVTGNQGNTGTGGTSQTTIKSDNNTTPSTDNTSQNKPSSSSRRGTHR